jgi:hypothetical protein
MFQRSVVKPSAKIELLDQRFYLRSVWVNSIFERFYHFVNVIFCNQKDGFHPTILKDRGFPAGYIKRILPCFQKILNRFFRS